MRRIVALGLIVTSCASTGSTMIGKDTYMASARSAFSGETGAKAKALQTAQNACSASGKMMKLVSMNTHECALHGGCGEAQITYLCLAKDDPRY